MPAGNEHLAAIEVIPRLAQAKSTCTPAIGVQTSSGQAEGFVEPKGQAGEQHMKNHNPSALPGSPHM